MRTYPTRFGFENVGVPVPCRHVFAVARDHGAAPGEADRELVVLIVAAIQSRDDEPFPVHDPNVLVVVPVVDGVAVDVLYGIAIVGLSLPCAGTPVAPCLELFRPPSPPVRFLLGRQELFDDRRGRVGVWFWLVLPEDPGRFQLQVVLFFRLQVGAQQSLGGDAGGQSHEGLQEARDERMRWG